jgi:membrane-associated phospholipid phosphatase
MKYTIKRPRPSKELFENTRRIGNLRKAEANTYSMPSGDATAVSLFCFFYATVLGLPVVYIILPLVLCGRLYYQCHYWGDVTVGCVVGTLWGVFSFLLFQQIWAPFGRLFLGSESFILVTV